MRKTAFLVLDYRNISDIFTKNLVGLQIADQIIVLHLKDALHVLLGFFSTSGRANTVPARSTLPRLLLVIYSVIVSGLFPIKFGSESGSSDDSSFGGVIDCSHKLANPYAGL